MQQQQQQQQQQRSQRYARRRRGWLGETASDAGDPSAESIGIPLTQPEESRRGRRRGRPHFDERIAATRELIEYTPEDEARIEATSHLLQPHIGAVTGQIYRELLSHPETSAPFRDAAGALDLEYVAVRQQAFEEWLYAVVADPLDAATAEYLGAVGLGYVRRERPDTRAKARYLLATASRVQVLFVAILAEALLDPRELAASSAAWCKQLMVHLDVLLAVYGSTEGSAHWY
jgi:hypothetical protein